MMANTNPAMGATTEYQSFEERNQIFIKTDTIKDLEKYFVDNNTNNYLNIFINGTRGSGKTAILFWLKDYLQHDNTFVIRIKPNIYAAFNLLPIDMMILYYSLGELFNACKNINDIHITNLDQMETNLTAIIAETEKAAYYDNENFNISKFRKSLIADFIYVLKILSVKYKKIIILIDGIEKFPDSEFAKLFEGNESIKNSLNEINEIQNENLQLSFVIAGRPLISKDVQNFFLCINGKEAIIHNIEWDIGYYAEMIRKRLEITSRYKLKDIIDGESLFKLFKAYGSNPSEIVMCLDHAWMEHTINKMPFKKMLDEYICRQGMHNKDFTINSEFLMAYKKYWGELKVIHDSNEKGRCLQDMMVFLFKSIKGFSILNTNVRTSSEEIDLIIKNHVNDSFLTRLGTPLIVECKNWSKPIGARDINWFIGIIKKRRLNVGILISMGGITGNNYKDAKLEIKNALNDGIKIIVIDKEILAGIYSPSDFERILEVQYYNIYKL